MLRRKERNLENIPVGALGLIPVRGCEGLGDKVNDYLVKWRKESGSEHKGDVAFTGYDRDTFIIDADVPRFGSGEAKGIIKESVPDIVQFNVSWYCDDPDNPAEVLTKCRLLESWSKSNAYQAAPPILQIQWGNSDTFEGHYYILTSATYSLSNFRNASRQRMKGSVDIREDLNLYPATATQELIFKRVSSYSLSYEDIVKSKAAEKTVGIFTTDKIK